MSISRRAPRRSPSRPNGLRVASAATANEPITTPAVASLPPSSSTTNFGISGFDAPMPTK